MSAALPARLVTSVALTLVAVLGHPASAQDDDPTRRDADLNTIERRTWRLLRERGASVLSVRVITRASSLPRLVLPGVTLSPPGGQAEQVDATGFLATPDGHVVTTSAAIRNAAMIEVRFSDGTVRDADLVGIDGPFQLAVLRTRAPGSPEPFSVPAQMRTTESALGWFFQAASGRPDVEVATVRPAHGQSTAYDRYLYSPRPLLAGAAGGPLLTTDGRLLGVAIGEIAPTSRHGAVSSRHGATSSRSDTPSPLATLFVRGDDVQRAVDDIVRFGRVRRPLLGVILEGDSNRIDQLLPAGPAERAGLREGDRIVGIAGDAVSSMADITRTLLRRQTGQAVDVAIERDDDVLVRSVRLLDVTSPPVPTTAPLPGAELEISAEIGSDGDRVVRVTDVVRDSALHQAGLQRGDRLVRVDGRSAMRFLARHRVRPADTDPRTLEIERGDTRHVISLGH